MGSAWYWKQVFSYCFVYVDCGLDYLREILLYFLTESLNEILHCFSKDFFNALVLKFIVAEYAEVP